MVAFPSLFASTKSTPKSIFSCPKWVSDATKKNSASIPVFLITHFHQNEWFFVCFTLLQLCGGERSGDSMSTKYNLKSYHDFFDPYCLVKTRSR